jgi:GntR family transcriptional regulator of arabinose operon
MSEQLVHTRKHEKIRQWILDGIRNGSIMPGDLIPSENEMCRQFESARGSVRQAIAGLVSEGWLKSQKGVGTFCVTRDRQLTMDIGLVCFFSGSYIFPRISRGCDQVAHRRGFHIVLNQSEDDPFKEREILEKLKKRRVDGILIEPVFDGSAASNADLLERIEASGTPVILLDNHFPGKAFTRIALDDEAGGRLVASHLWNRGHRDIGILWDAGYLPKRTRRDAAASFLADSGAAPRAEWQVEYRGPVSSGRAAAALKRLFDGGGPLPTAFICTSDEEAMELYRAAESRGVGIPRDLSVISFDNSSLADLPGISLTSVDHPGQYMGEMAVQILLERLLNPGIGSTTTSLITPRLVERGSVRDQGS